MTMDAITVPAAAFELVTRLVLAAVLGAAIGLNRELQRKPAGLRTHALVALSSAALTLVALLLEPPGSASQSGAASRVLQGIVAGIGFIGGGVILHRDDTKGVHGLTTAASIWVVAAVGIAVAAGLWWSSLTIVVLTLLILIVGEPIDRALKERAGGGATKAGRDLSPDRR